MADGKSLSVSRGGEDEARRLSDIGSSNPGQLAELHSERRISAKIIGQYLGFSRRLINQALDFYSIPRKETAGKRGGKYTSVFQKLKVGESSEKKSFAEKRLVSAAADSVVFR